MINYIFLFYYFNWLLTKESHTCEEGDGTLQNILLAFIDEIWKTRKIRILKKMKTNCWRYHHFTYVYQKPQLYEVQFLRYEVRENFFVILPHSLPFYLPLLPLTIQKTKNDHFEKMKKTLGDNTISLSRTCSWCDKLIVLWTLNS